MVVDDAEEIKLKNDENYADGLQFLVEAILFVVSKYDVNEIEFGNDSCLLWARRPEN